MGRLPTASSWLPGAVGADPFLSTPILGYLDWLTVEKGRSPRTIESYRLDLEAYEAGLANRGVSLLSASATDVDQHLSALRAAGRAPASIARARSSIRGLHRFLIDEGQQDVDPSRSAPAVRVPARIPKALPEDLVVGLIEGISGDDPLSLRDRAILELLYGTGARVSELTSLDLDDLAFDDGLLRVTGKGDRQRLVPVGRAAQEALGRWCASEGRDRLIVGITRREDQAALFVNLRGRRISRQGIHLAVANRARRAGITTAVSPHVLRHSCATHMLAHGADVRVVQELLGHASVATTQLYTKVNRDHLHAAYRSAHPRAGE